MVKVNAFLLSLFGLSVWEKTIFHEVYPVESVYCFDDIQNAMELHIFQQLDTIKTMLNLVINCFSSPS